MADADTKEITPPTGESALNAQLTEVQDQLRKMNDTIAAQQSALIAATQTKSRVQEDDDNIYDPVKAQKAVLKKADEIFETRYKEEKSKDMMIFNLSQEYPEIQKDTKLRQSILDAQKELPQAIRDTANGYEHAVLKAVSKAGLIPKSKRPVIDEDTSFSSNRGGGSSRPRGKVKVSEATLAVSQLLGRDISDEKVLKGLEEAANRDTFTKYR